MEGFCYQPNTRSSQAAKCGQEEFWRSVRNMSTAWKIDSRREILKAVEEHNAEVIGKWLKNEDYGRFLAKKRDLKQPKARQKFFEKNDEERLLAFAQELKNSLVAFIFSCREFDATATARGTMFCHRRLADCHLNGLVMLDIDHVDNPLEVYEAWKANDELVRRTALVHITSSGKGIRFVFTANVSDGNLADNQIVFSQMLGYPCDQSTIDATRNSFAPKEEDILYMNENLLFDYYDEEFDREYTPMYRDKKTQPLHHQFTADGNAAGAHCAETAAVAGKDDEQGGEDGSEVDAGAVPMTWRGYDVQSIVDARYEGKLPCAADSNRHNESLKLASDLLLLFDGDKQKTLQVLMAQKWVQEIIDERDENVSQTVDSAADRMRDREKKYLSQQPSKTMQDAIQKALGKSWQEITQGTQAPAAVTESDMDRWLWDWGEQIEEMSKDFPLLKDITKGLKKNQYPAALFVSGGVLMTLMTRCTYRFYHRPEELRRLNNSTLIIGDPASGKSFATRLFKLLAAPMVSADKAGIAAINRYKEEMKTKGANKEKPQKPKALFRVHPARTSNAQFIQDMVNAVEEVDGKEMQLHMLTFDTELDNTMAVQKGGTWIDKQSMELKAFHNEEDGQAYSNLDSVVQNFFVTWNYIYTGTPIALRKKVNEQNFGSGLATRLTCIPLPSTNFEMMAREKTVDTESDGRLKEWAFKLDRVKGLLSLDKIVDELYDWTARRMADAKENNSKADEMLLKRCAYHGLNFSAPFIVMRHWDCIHQEGNYWCGEFETDEVDWRLAELIVNIQYACQRHFFGAMAEKYFDDQRRDISANTRRNQKTIEAFNRLPEEFTAEDIMRCFGLEGESSARTRAHKLLADHLAVKTGEFKDNGKVKAQYRKTGRAML